MIADVASVPTPAGMLTIVSSDGAVLATGWNASLEEIVARIHPLLRPGSIRERRDLGSVTQAVDAYLAGDLAAVDDVAVLQRGGPFLEQVWTVLRTIPPGRPLTYAALAAAAGRPAAVRAAAQGCARNAPALFVPCHRVVRTGGAPGGYRWGLDVKRWLLAHEAG